jgi:hypothetical protein
MKKHFFIIFIILFGCGQSFDRGGINLIIEENKLEIAKADFPEKMTWEEAR